MQCNVQDEGQGIVLDQFGNLANPLAHYKGTGPEVWEQTKGQVTHFVSSMGTTGTIMGTSKYLKEQNPDVRIVGLQPKEGSAIAGIRRWPKEYLPTIFQVTVRPHICDPTHLLVHMSVVGEQAPFFIIAPLPVVSELITMWAVSFLIHAAGMPHHEGNTRSIQVLTRLLHCKRALPWKPRERRLCEVLHAFFYAAYAMQC